MTKGAVHDLSGGQSKILWEIELIWNGGRKSETEGFYWSDSPDAVNGKAMSLWNILDPAYRDNEENVDGSKTKSGQPYTGFACIQAGSASCMMTVKAVKQHQRYGGNWDPEMDKYYPSPCTTGNYGIQALKRIAKSRNIPVASGESKDALAQKVHDYLHEWIPASKEVARSAQFGVPDSWPGEADAADLSTANEEEAAEPLAKKAKPAAQDATPAVDEKTRMAFAMYEGDPKGDILETANGLGAGQYRRGGNDLLTASAKALSMPRNIFVALLKAAPGDVDPWHREGMSAAELAEIGC